MMKNEAAARTPDDGALYALGNGLIVAYGHGAEWEQVFGTPYTSPTALSLKRLSDAPYAPPRRAPARGVWVHETDVGTLEDTLANGGAHGGAIACLARRWRVSSPSRWRVGGRGFALTRDADLFPGCADAYLLTIPGGSPAYNWYPTHAFQYMQLVFTGGCRSGQSGDAIEFEVFGEGALFVASGADYPACIAAARAGLALGFDGMAAQNAASDAAFLSARRKNAFPVDEAHPRARAVQAAADDVALLIRSQQGAEGGVLAGSNYHMGYVRDQYGVARGLLAMGCFDEAKAILRFYQEVFRVSGAVRNAQGIGVPDMFHLHEDDDSEITGYLVCQICDMLDATCDRALLNDLAPLAEWALRAQVGRLHRDMMPFNGDETYVAGGILPRTALLDGSMEATMLFILGAERYAAALGGVRPEWLKDVLAAAARCRAAFRSNFFRGDGWVSNSRLRREGLAFPAFRHGVCLRRMADPEAGFHFGWLRHAGDSWYVCPECYGKGRLPPVEDTEYRLRSVLLMHAYMGSDLIGRDELRRETQAALDDYRRTGAPSSLPGGDKSLGYDYGLLLYAADALGLDASDLLAHMLAVRDSAGAWVEYYVDNRPLGTRCRPWESGINIEAALRVIRRLEG